MKMDKWWYQLLLQFDKSSLAIWGVIIASLIVSLFSLIKVIILSKISHKHEVAMKSWEYIKTLREQNIPLMRDLQSLWQTLQEMKELIDETEDARVMSEDAIISIKEKLSRIKSFFSDHPDVFPKAISDPFKKAYNKGEEIRKAFTELRLICLRKKRLARKKITSGAECDRLNIDTETIREKLRCLKNECSILQSETEKKKKNLLEEQIKEHVKLILGGWD